MHLLKMDAVVQVITTTAKGVEAGTAWFSKCAREYAQKLATETIKYTVNGVEHETTVVPEDAYYLFTNLHVVNGGETVSIRLPSMHSRDIPVDVIGHSDLDIAALRLSGPYLDMVRDRLGVIPELEMGDSDLVVPNHKVKRCIARGYPLGCENQQFTSGIVSGIKHVMGQEYLSSEVSINPGNSGGPILYKDKVVGINTLKIVEQGIENINLHIPSNRVKVLLPHLIDNHFNDMQKRAQEIAISTVNFASLLNEEHKEIGRKLVAHAGVPLDTETAQKLWVEHHLGGFHTVDGTYKARTVAEWYDTYVHEKRGAHHLLKKVLTHLHEGDVDKIKEMRRVGFDHFLCQSCEFEPCGLETEVHLITQPRVVHIPRMAFRYSHTNEAARSFFATDKTGVVVSEIYPNSALDRAGLKKMDYITAIETSSIYPLNEYGEWFYDKTQTALTLHDIIRRTPLNTDITFHIKRGSQELAKVVKYHLLTDNDRPEIRAEMRDPVCEFQGLAIKQMRLQDVSMFKKVEYLEPHRQMEKKFMIMSIDPRSKAFHEYNIQAGDIIQSMSGEVPESIQHVAQLLSEPHVVLETESGIHFFKNST